ncbi:helix-turn-helix domain-containing protein [Rhizobium sp. L1K21]|uniref:helix-turn-helix domain-containing protein n=1 Tax=Rhizobium sp. L1K21 TaxID=2954933 RepID=UPI0020936EDC|nr:helix-turn-helix domain-containing protein [Rhizobium sp. L1K21]MCO6187414.1 helix-turn-helix domain-containing protein [Rhizobium sp. L1K21]
MENSIETLEARIGDDLKTLRTAKGLTIDQLAAESGVSRAMISRVERGEANPTAVLLARLLGPLGQSLSDFFALADTKQNVTPLRRRGEQGAWRDPQTGYLRRSVSPNGFNTGVDIIEVELPGKARVSYDPLPTIHNQSQYVWLFEGALEMDANGQTHQMAAGDCLFMTLNQRHVFHNPADHPCRYAVILKKS